jgi:hypothetical protein
MRDLFAGVQKPFAPGAPGAVALDAAPRRGHEHGDGPGEARGAGQAAATA